MKKPFHQRCVSEEGYAILLVLFLVAVVIIGGSVAVLDQLTEGRREKEAVMIWRGKEYERAIRMYYRKFGRFPTSIDDLVKVQNGAVRFLREPYTNPMNQEDGTWRFIYVTPAGQLIGSVRYVSLQQMAFLDQQRRLGRTAGQGALGMDGSSGTQPPTDNSPDAAGQSGANQGPGWTPSLQAPPQFGGQNPQSPGGSSFFAQPPQAQPSSSGSFGVQESSQNTDASGQVIGGFIIGVAGKSEKRSIKVYKDGMTYKQWEFIFNPLEQVQTIGTILSAPQLNPSGMGANGQPVPNQPPQQQPQIPQQPQ